jgi:indole-3-glycerol phosphate synthase
LSVVRCLSLSLVVQTMIKKFFKKVDRLLTAIAFAEAGNLDAVQEILDQNEAEKALAKKNRLRAINAQDISHHGMRGVNAR